MAISDVLNQEKTLSFVYGGIYTGFSALSADSVVSLTKNNQSTITDKPVQDGAKISDNMILEPLIIDTEFIIKDDGLSIFDGVQYVTSGQTNEKLTAQEKESRLEGIRRSREPFDIVVYGDRTYDNMGFASLNFVYDREFNGRKVIRVLATMKQIAIIETETVDVPATAVKSPATNAPKQDNGKVQSTEVKESSVLFSIGSAIFGG